MEQAAQMNPVPCAEDKVLKVAMQAFGESIRKYLGHTDTIKRVAPTEHVHLETRQMLEDFNFEMQEGYWRHYEFESDRISVEDMRRFREYEAFLSMMYQVPVITTVLCSATAKSLRSELTEGINTYRIETVHLKSKNADEIIRRIEFSINAGLEITLDDLIPLLLTPLMSGKTTIYERIRQGFCILKTVSGQFDLESIRKMYAILYTFACKFLNTEELYQIKGVIGMTVLGEMLMNDGIEKGKIEGRIEGKIEGKIEGRLEGSMTSYLNAINKGLSHDDARDIAGITDEAAANAMALRKEGKL